MSGEDCDALDRGDNDGQKPDKMFTLKKWNAVAMWSWDVECDTCAICRVQVMGKYCFCWYIGSLDSHCRVSQVAGVSKRCRRRAKCATQYCYCYFAAIFKLKTQCFRGSLHLPSGSFQHLQVIQHCTKPICYSLNELHSILKPGGQYLVWWCT